MLKNFLIKIYRNLVILIDNKNSEICSASIGDIYMQRCNIEHNQFLAASRYKDIERYCNETDKNFFYQNTISRLTYGAEHQEEAGNKSFMKLIESYKLNGYQEGSVLTVDSNLRLMDGNHRVAANLFFGVDGIKIKVLKRKDKNPKNIDWYYANLIDTNVVRDVILTYKEIQGKLIRTGNTFCVRFAAIENVGNSIIEDLNGLVNILYVHPAKKMGGYNDYLVQFSVTDPSYNIVNKQVISERCVQIEQIIQKRYTECKFKVSKSCLEGKYIFDDYNGGN